MRLTDEGLKDRQVWLDHGYTLPQYDRERMRQATLATPRWIHFGAGNIFRAFMACLQQRLLELGHTYSEPTGTFDELTEQGVMNFQFLSDMVADGIADDALLDALYAPDAVKGPNYGLR